MNTNNKQQNAVNGTIIVTKNFIDFVFDVPDDEIRGIVNTVGDCVGGNE